MSESPEVVPARSARSAPRLDPLAVRRQLRGEGITARHSMSQNFLADPDVLQSILDLSAPEPGRRTTNVRVRYPASHRKSCRPS